MLKKKRRKKFLQVTLLLNSMLSASLAYGFMGGTEVSMYIKILCGFIFSLTPSLAVYLIIIDSKNWTIAIISVYQRKIINTWNVMDTKRTCGVCEWLWSELCRN